MRQLFVILVAGLLFIWTVAVGAQQQGRPLGDPSQGRTLQGAPSQVPDTDQIRKAQEQLKASGYDPGPVDGNLGPQTKEALQDFQKARGLPQTGMLDEATQRVLMASGTTGRGSTMGGSGSTGTEMSPGSGTGAGGSSQRNPTGSGSTGGSMGR
jgi:peptidoglycan hydrolase-like protein with peptidoglycan-binding domain